MKINEILPESKSVSESNFLSRMANRIGSRLGLSKSKGRLKRDIMVQQVTKKYQQQLAELDMEHNVQNLLGFLDRFGMKTDQAKQHAEKNPRDIKGSIAVGVVDTLRASKGIQEPQKPTSARPQGGGKIPGKLSDSPGAVRRRQRRAQQRAAQQQQQKPRIRTRAIISPPALSKKGISEFKESLRVDVPSEEWLNTKIRIAKENGRDEYGAPYMGTTTAYIKDNIKLPVDLLKQLPGKRGEQKNVRKKDLEKIMQIMQDTGKLPLLDSGEEYAPFIQVAWNGEAWVSEGNHRIMAAAELGWKELPVELRYYDGGERIKSGALYPGKIGI